MLKIEWLTGDKSGQQEENREENINASIYKYEQSRGLLGTIGENKEVVTLSNLSEQMNDLRELINDSKSELAVQLAENNRILKWYEEDRTSVLGELKRMEETITAQNKVIDEIYKHLQRNTNRIDEVLETGEKRDEVIKDIENTVDKNTNLMQTITSNLEIFQNQQKMMDKLLEKI